jgi:hypothetical protein
MFKSWQILAQIDDGDQNDNNRLNNYRIMLPITVDALRFKIKGSAANDYGFVDDGDRHPPMIRDSGRRKPRPTRSSRLARPASVIPLPALQCEQHSSGRPCA